MNRAQRYPGGATRGTFVVPAIGNVRLEATTSEQSMPAFGRSATFDPDLERYFRS